MSVKVFGIATGCSKVNVSIICTGSHAVTHSDVPVSSGAWDTTFTEQEIKLAGCLKCGDPNYPITVRANCADPGSSCSDFKMFPSIPCAPACPTIDHIEADIPTCDAVHASGDTWHVAFRAYINGTGVTSCIWTFGDGSNPVVGSLPQGGIATANYSYQCAGEYFVTLIIQSDCQPGYINSEVYTLEIPTCGCPTVSSFTAHPDASNPCTWCFEAKVGGPFYRCIDKYLWDFGDGHTEYSETPNICHTYSSGGTRTVTLTIIGSVGQVGGGPCSSPLTINVTNCGNGGGHGGGDPCPWWDPRCWSLCGWLLALALATMASAAGLFIAWGCSSYPPLLVAAIAAAALGLALLALWGALCAKTHCHTLCAVITFVEYMILLQGVIAIILAIFSPPCSIGAFISSAYYGTALVVLLHINETTHCGCHSL
jgi:hypothetical protein